VNIDDCWQASSRDEAGNIVPDSERFPGGMKVGASECWSRMLTSVRAGLRLNGMV